MHLEACDKCRAVNEHDPAGLGNLGWWQAIAAVVSAAVSYKGATKAAGAQIKQMKADLEQRKREMAEQVKIQRELIALEREKMQWGAAGQLMPKAGAPGAPPSLFQQNPGLITALAIAAPVAAFALTRMGRGKK